MVEDENVSWVKCSPEEYALVLRFRNDVISLKTEFRRAEERRTFYLEDGNLEMAKLTSETIDKIVKEIKGLEREVEHLESVCL